jgi:hypothetical protein
MKMKLDYGYLDREDVEVEDRRNKQLTNIQSEIVEDEFGAFQVILTTPYRYELVRYAKRFFSDMPEIADMIVDENIIKD